MNNNQSGNKQTNNGLSYEDIQKALTIHIWKNDHLRSELVKNPKAVIERELKVKFDENIKISIINHTDPKELSFILPYNINKVASQELSDDQLEEVAGGFLGGLMTTIAGMAGANKKQMEIINGVGGIVDVGENIGLSMIPGGSIASGIFK